MSGFQKSAVKMSLVVITHHDENIFNINKNEEQFPKKKDEGKNEREPLKRGLHLTKRYMDLIKKSECKQPNSTMGPPFIELPDPANFLKKGTGNQTKPICLNLEKRVPLVQKKPPIPPVLSKSKPKKHVNFVSKNIQNVKMMKSKEPNLRVVVHPLGDVKPLRYFKKGKEFAQVPHYLVKLKSHVEEKRLREKEAVSIKQPLCTYITSDQREALLQVTSLLKRQKLV